MGLFWGRRMGLCPTPTPEQVSFSLCTRAELLLLSTLFIQTEAAGWFSHLCVCRYIDFVLKEDRLTPATGGVFVTPPLSIQSPWGSQEPGELEHRIQAPCQGCPINNNSYSC